MHRVSAPGQSYGTRGAVLFERDRELAAIEGALAAAVAGAGWLLLFEGPAGIGKTALLEAVRKRASDAGVALASARGGELEGDFPYAVIRQLFEPLVRDATAARRKRLLAGAARFAAPVVLAGKDGLATSTDAGFAVIHGLYWLVANLASEVPLVLTVDDIHWADAPSLRFLIYLARRLEGLRVTIIASNRPSDEGLNRLSLEPHGSLSLALIRRLARLTSSSPQTSWAPANRSSSATR